MAEPIVVIGGGIGGMVAALRARRAGAAVTLLEARDQLGGLASPLVVDGTTFDGGPYILLDRERLSWALDEVGIDFGELDPIDLDPAYTVETGDGVSIAIHRDLAQTAEGFDRHERGAGATYRRFVERASRALGRLSPLLTESHDISRFVTSGAWPSAPWVLGSLGQLTRAHRLSPVAAQAVSIWTSIAGGDSMSAPGPMALVPALIHRDGACRPAGGLHTIVGTLGRELEAAGVTIVRSAPVASIVTDRVTKSVSAVLLEDGESVETATVISDVGGSTALLDLLDVEPPRSLQRRLNGPLQSPGIAAYFRVRGSAAAEIRFRVDGERARARAVIMPTSGCVNNDWMPGRLIAPLSHAEAERLGPDGQRRLLDSYLSDPWWRSGSDSADLEIEPAATRLVGDWGRTFRLRDDAMNLVMARRQMLLGRLPHEVAAVPGLYLTGSWTHPGQWISFCAVSGVLAADHALNAGVS